MLYSYTINIRSSLWDIYIRRIYIFIHSIYIQYIGVYIECVVKIIHSTRQMVTNCRVSKHKSIKKPMTTCEKENKRKFFQLNLIFIFF